MTSPGYISIATITILAPPRPVDPTKGDRNVVFDANFFIVDGSQTSSLGLLRYFVPDDMIDAVHEMADKDFQKAFVVANITSIKKNAIPHTLIPDDLEITDYAFVGDVVQLIVIDDEANAKTPPHITVAGVVTHFNRTDHSFAMNPSQYANLLHTSSSLPIHGDFIDSKRWTNGKPKLSVGMTIAVSGFVEVIRRDSHNADRQVTSVEIQVVNVTFLSSRAGAQAIPSRSTTRGAVARTRFNYDESSTLQRSDDAPSTSQQSELSPVAEGKRKRQDNSSGDEKEIKRERTVSDHGDDEK